MQALAPGRPCALAPWDPGDAVAVVRTVRWNPLRSQRAAVDSGNHRLSGSQPATCAARSSTRTWGGAAPLGDRDPSVVPRAVRRAPGRPVGDHRPPMHQVDATDAQRCRLAEMHTRVGQKSTTRRTARPARHRRLQGLYPEGRSPARSLNFPAITVMAGNLTEDADTSATRQTFPAVTVTSRKVRRALPRSAAGPRECVRRPWKHPCCCLHGEGGCWCHQSWRPRGTSRETSVRITGRAAASAHRTPGSTSVTAGTSSFSTASPRMTPRRPQLGPVRDRAGDVASSRPPPNGDTA